MAKRTVPPQKYPAELSAGDIQAAIPKLKRRLAEVESFNPGMDTDEVSTEARAIVDKMEATLQEIFGPDTTDYDRYRVSTLYAGPIFVGRSSTPRERVDGYRKGQQSAATKLRTAIATLEEKLEDMGLSGAPGVPRSLQGADLHPAVEAAAGQLFRDGHYANAVENACKALNNLIQARTGIYDTDNTDLARRVFSAKNPKLAFNALADDTDRSEQEGMMHLYEGAFLAFRNPRAHKLVEDAPEVAYGGILTVSFLARMLDRTTVR